MKNKQFNIVLQEELFKKLRKQSEREFRSMSEIARQLILKYLEDKEGIN